MQATSKVVENVVVITLMDRIDFSIRNTLRRLVNEAITQGYRHFVVNMKEVTFIDSSGLGALVASFSTIRRQGGTMRLVQVPQQVYALLEMTKLTSFFEIFEREEAAIARAMQET
ncbi:MAG: anti-sigma factor antagonist [Nitrospinota bacterium]|nr:MAG: anti-sigma factor antagonist [Nitrospinota bacterium]